MSTTLSLRRPRSFQSKTTTTNTVRTYGHLPLIVITKEIYVIEAYRPYPTEQVAEKPGSTELADERSQNGADATIAQDAQ